MHQAACRVRLCCRVSSSSQTLLCRLCVGVSQGTIRLPLMKPWAEGSAHCSFSILHDTQEPPASYQGAAAHRVMLLQNKRFLNPLTDYLLRLCEGLIILHDLRKCLFVFSSFSWASCITAHVSGYFPRALPCSQLSSQAPLLPLGVSTTFRQLTDA